MSCTAAMSALAGSSTAWRSASSAGRGVGSRPRLAVNVGPLQAAMVNGNSGLKNRNTHLQVKAQVEDDAKTTVKETDKDINNAARDLRREAGGAAERAEGAASEAASKAREVAAGAERAWQEVSSAAAGGDGAELNDRVKALLADRTDYGLRILDNMKQGSFGTRGEAWFAGQLALLFLLFFPPSFIDGPLSVIGLRGGWCSVPLPGLGGLLDLLLGPVAFLAGGATLYLGAQRQGGQLTPFPKPTPSAELVTDGAYQYARHPMYAGLFLFALGLAKLTCSPGRFLVVAALGAFLDKKAAREEDLCAEQFGQAYRSYQQEVKKFIPYLY